jgi:hypothetical protein
MVREQPYADAALDRLVSPLPESHSSGQMRDDLSGSDEGGAAGIPIASRTQVQYTTWAARVFDAFARCAGNSGGMVGLPAVAAALGFDGLTWDDFAKHEAMPEALVTATIDLDKLGLVLFGFIDYGNELTPAGRRVADAGLASIWPELTKIHLSDRETTFLTKLYEASVVDGEGWADLRIVDADEVADLIGLDAGDFADLARRRTFLGDLELKGLLKAGPRYGGGPNLYRPTYVAAVLLTESVGQEPSRVAGPAELSASAVATALQPGTPRPKGRPRGTGYIANYQVVLDAYRRAKQRPDRNPSKTPSLVIVAKELDVSARTLADYLKAQEIPWPPE